MDERPLIPYANSGREGDRLKRTEGGRICKRASLAGDVRKLIPVPACETTDKEGRKGEFSGSPCLENHRTTLEIALLL